MPWPLPEREPSRHTRLPRSKSTDRDRTEIQFGNKVEVSLLGFARTTIHPETDDPEEIARPADTPRPKRPMSQPCAANTTLRMCHTRPNPDARSGPIRRQRAAAAPGFRRTSLDPSGRLQPATIHHP